MSLSCMHLYNGDHIYICNHYCSQPSIHRLTFDDVLREKQQFYSRLSSHHQIRHVYKDSEVERSIEFMSLYGFSCIVNTLHTVTYVSMMVMMVIAYRMKPIYSFHNFQVSRNDCERTSLTSPLLLYIPFPNLFQQQ